MIVLTVNKLNDFRVSQFLIDVVLASLIPNTYRTLLLMRPRLIQLRTGFRISEGAFNRNKETISERVIAACVDRNRLFINW